MSTERIFGLSPFIPYAKICKEKVLCGVQIKKKLIFKETILDLFCISYIHTYQTTVGEPCEQRGKPVLYSQTHSQESCDNDSPGTREVEGVDYKERGGSGATTGSQIGGEELPELRLLIDSLHEDVLVRVLERKVEGLGGEVPKIQQQWVSGLELPKSHAINKTWKNGYV